MSLSQKLYHMSSEALSLCSLCLTPVAAVVVVVFCLILLADSSCAASPSSIRLHGRTQLTGFTWEGKPFVDVYDTFTLDMDQSGRWLMTSYSTMHTNGYIVNSYDGTNMFSVLYSRRVQKSVKNVELTEEVPYEHGPHSATISANEYPLDMIPILRFSWFALVSGQYLSRAPSNTLPAPWLEARTDLLAYCFSNRYDQEVAWPMCLRSAQFTTSPQSPDKDIPTLRLPNDKVSLAFRQAQQSKAKQLEPNVLAAQYSVQHYTDFSGIKIPIAYTLDVFWSGVGVNPTNSHVAQRFTGSITNIETVPETTGRPEAIGSITVSDFRFNFSDAKNALQVLRYKIADHRWKDTSDPTLQRGYEIMKTHSPRFNNLVNRVTKRSTLLLMLFVFVAPLFWLFITKKRI